jgi:5'-nucleotidase
MKKILITNDDGVHAQGIIQLARRVQQSAEVFVIAPATEQSGVAQAITFLTPLFPVRLGGEKDSQDDQIPGYSVNGTPVDCVRLGINELCPWKPDLILSGINGGLNAGVNVCYSGTVGGAMAGASCGILSMAISVEYESRIDYHRAAEIAWPLIEQLAAMEHPPRTVLNINIPTAALTGDPEIHVVPVETKPLGYVFDRGVDPKGRRFFWAKNETQPFPSQIETDNDALRAGHITISGITYDPNSMHALTNLRGNLSRLTNQPVV